jgi:hypothetical protein
VIGFDIAFGRLTRVFDADPRVCEIPEHKVTVQEPEAAAIRA